MPYIRIQTAANPNKQFRQLAELRRSPDFINAVVIAQTTTGYHVLGQSMGLDEIAAALLAAADGIARAKGDMTAKARELKISDPKPEEGPPPKTPENYGRARTPEIVKKPDGTLDAPAGENFVFCGECGAAKWFVTQDAEALPVRYACTSCGNEIKLLRLSPATGGTA
jgi:hypothetical protein